MFARMISIHEHSVWPSMDTLGIEPRAFRMRSGCDTTTPCAPTKKKLNGHQTGVDERHRRSHMDTIENDFARTLHLAGDRTGNPAC